jgi:hypothetical protein
MQNKSELLKSIGLKNGSIVEEYYGNGSFSGTTEIIEIGEYYVFHKKSGIDHRFRDSHNTVLEYLSKGLWRLK